MYGNEVRVTYHRSVSTSAPRSTRDRPAKAPLSLHAVVEAGLRVLKHEGLDAVTMRRLAAELDTGAASLYVYVANRQALLHEMLDRVAATIPVEAADPTRWREQTTALLRATVAAMDSHPGIARVAMAHIPTGEGALRVAEALTAALRAGGVPDASAAWAVDILMLHATAVAFEHSIQVEEAQDEAAIVADVTARFAALPPERYPNLVTLLPAMTAGGGDERFAFGLDLLINGLLTTPAPTTP